MVASWLWLTLVCCVLLLGCWLVAFVDCYLLDYLSVFDCVGCFVFVFLYCNLLCCFVF